GGGLVTICRSCGHKQISQRVIHFRTAANKTCDAMISVICAITDRPRQKKFVPTCVGLSRGSVNEGLLRELELCKADPALSANPGHLS
ncbi:MAG TPA: hypothetical protein VMB71_12140, partial [Acetobacteraceae bacterium]|nr:hypothetical protein [Acetobacteraceae bacterium]